MKKSLVFLNAQFLALAGIYLFCGIVLAQEDPEYQKIKDKFITEFKKAINEKKEVLKKQKKTLAMYGTFIDRIKKLLKHDLDELKDKLDSEDDPKVQRELKKQIYDFDWMLSMIEFNDFYQSSLKECIENEEEELEKAEKELKEFEEYY